MKNEKWKTKNEERKTKNEKRKMKNEKYKWKNKNEKQKKKGIKDCLEFICQDLENWPRFYNFGQPRIFWKILRISFFKFEITITQSKY